eukprot:Skav232937  [mRNA]  locus=scaffold3951:30733:30990:+ [translate_table: standard]
MKGFGHEVLPVIHEILKMKGPVVRWSISEAKYLNLAKYLGRMTCFRMISVALDFAGLEGEGLKLLQPHLNVLRFKEPTCAANATA